MSIKAKTVVALIFFGIVDSVIPIPILGIILLYVVLERPSWFRDAVLAIYRTE